MSKKLWKRMTKEWYSESELPEIAFLVEHGVLTVDKVSVPRDRDGMWIAASVRIWLTTEQIQISSLHQSRGSLC